MAKQKLSRPKSSAERKQRVEIVIKGLELACPLERYERRNNLGWNSIITAVGDLGAQMPPSSTGGFPVNYCLDSYWARKNGAVSANLAQDCDLCDMGADYVWECVWRSGLLDYLLEPESG